MMNWMYGYGGTCGGWGGWLWMVFWWVLVVVGIVVLVRWLMEQRGGEGRRGGAGALDILKERYARGEIDKKEFEEKRKELTS